MWRIFTIRRELNDGRRHNRAEREDAEAEIRRLEGRTDSMLKTSLRTVGFVALAAWVLLGATFVMDAMGVRWARRITAKASYYWKASTASIYENHHSSRNEILHGMSAGVK